MQQDPRTLIRTAGPNAGLVLVQGASLVPDASQLGRTGVVDVECVLQASRSKYSLLHFLKGHLPGLPRGQGLHRPDHGRGGWPRIRERRREATPEPSQQQCVGK